jgi:hypothetical protein
MTSDPAYTRSAVKALAHAVEHEPDFSGWLAAVMRAAAALLATTACGDRRLQAVILGADRLAGIARVLAFWLAYVLRRGGSSPREIADRIITESIRIEAQDYTGGESP